MSFLTDKMVDFSCDKCDYTCSVPDFVIKNCEHICKISIDKTPNQKKLDEWHKKNRKFKKQLKENISCEMCGESNNILLDFAHYDRNNKKLQFSNSVSIDSMKSELKKGRFLCVWCHRIETENEIKDIRKVIDEFAYSDNYVLGNLSHKCGGKLCRGKSRNENEFCLSEIKSKAISKHCRKCYGYNQSLRKIRGLDFIKKKKKEIGK